MEHQTERPNNIIHKVVKRTLKESNKYPSCLYELSVLPRDITGSLICRDLYKAYVTEYDDANISESIKIEDKYIEAVRLFMKVSGCRYFYVYERYSFLEYRPNCPLFTDISEKDYQMANKKRLIATDNIDVYIRLLLRNIHWFRLANMKRHISVYFGNDYHVILNTRTDGKTIGSICKKLGIKCRMCKINVKGQLP